MPDSEGLFSKTPIEVKLEAEITRLRAELAEAERERDIARSIMSIRDLNRFDILLKETK